MEYKMCRTVLNGKLFGFFPDLCEDLFWLSDECPDDYNLNKNNEGLPEGQVLNAIASMLIAFKKLQKAKQPIYEFYNEEGFRINVPIIIAAKIHLYNALLSSGMSYADFGRKVGLSATQVNRIFNFYHNSRMEELELAAKAFNKTFDLVLLSD